MKKCFFIGAVFLSFVFLVSCGSGGGGSGKGIDGSKRTGNGEKKQYQMPLPQPGTTLVTQGKGAKIDASNANSGYAIVTCSTGRSKRLKVQIQSGNQTYDFDVNNSGSPEVFPFSMGNGTYQVSVMENIDGNRYTPIASTQVPVALLDPQSPFLLPNQYVNYNANSQAISFGYELTRGCGNDVETVNAIYDWIVKNVQYDYDKAASVQPGYVPNIDSTLSTKKGICFDYSSLAAAMLRSQGIPTKLVTGQADVGKQQSIGAHAWNMIYTKEQGWIAKTIQFDGKNFQVVDTTLDAGGNHEAVTYYGSNQY